MSWFNLDLDKFKFTFVAIRTPANEFKCWVTEWTSRFHSSKATSNISDPGEPSHLLLIVLFAFSLSLKISSHLSPIISKYFMRWLTILSPSPFKVVEHRKYRAQRGKHQLPQDHWPPESWGLNILANLGSIQGMSAAECYGLSYLVDSGSSLTHNSNTLPCISLAGKETDTFLVS